jgi:hypothetical protein
MMGRVNRDQGPLFYSFCLDEVVPENHRGEIAADLICPGSTPKPHPITRKSAAPRSIRCS